MSRKAAIGIFTVVAVLALGFMASWAYYYGVWPKPTLTVDDPAINQWLQDDDVAVHRQGFQRSLANARMYLDQGQRVDGGCRWHTSLSLQGGEPGPRVARTLASNRLTCERLVVEGVRAR